MIFVICLKCKGEGWLAYTPQNMPLETITTAAMISWPVLSYRPCLPCGRTGLVSVPIDVYWIEVRDETANQHGRCLQFPADAAEPREPDGFFSGGRADRPRV